MRKYILSSLFWLLLILVIIFTTQPSPDNALIIFSYFVCLFAFTYAIAHAVMIFLNYRKRNKQLGIVIASSITLVQVFLTFQALRWAELLLLTTSLGIMSWYFFKSRS